jgi:hypothetical protein
MKILFVMRSTIYVRNLESTLRLLADRGHEVHVVAEPHPLYSTGLVERLCAEHPTLRYSQPPPIPFDRWSFLGMELRRTLDYMRYLGPEFADSRKLRSRAERNVPEIIVSGVPRQFFDRPVGRSVFTRVLRWCDRAIPPDPGVEDFIRAENPDLVLVTPLVEPGSPQSDYLRAARALGIRTALCVYSWDNLTNKGLIHDRLDLVTVWNEPMKREAMTLHRVPAERVVVTGAAAWDHWFTWKPRATREAFCARVGLRPSQPYLLYLCSSKFIAPDEVPFVRRWVQQIRESSPTLRDVGVLVRPHPQWVKVWAEADVTDLGDVVVWPRGGANPVDDESRADYYDSIYYSAGVVGVNTSSQIESAIVGRGVYTVLDPEFRDTQDGTLHFHHLTSVNGGLLHTAADFAEHVGQLETAVRTAGADDGRCRRFIEGFVRPYGLDQAAAPRLVAALEATAALGPRPKERDPLWGPVLRRALLRIALPVTQTARARKEKLARNARVKKHRHAERAARKAAWAAQKKQINAEKALRKQEAAARVVAERLASEAMTANAYDKYVAVRDRVRQMCAGGNGNGGAPLSLTEAEQRMVSALAHLWDATPDTIGTLRRWCGPITGVRASDYDTPKSSLEMLLRREHRRLRRQVGPGLFVGEPMPLGGFGYVAKDGRFNEDTLKFFNVLVALQDAAIIEEYQRGPERRLVWEIGGGWGGFAYQFKTIHPNVTYLITGAPEMLLVAAVYLMTVMPDARCRFYGESPGGQLWDDWETVDFMFAPETAVDTLRPPRVDLTLDIMAMRHMSLERVRAHVERAFDAGSRFLYSLLPASAVADGAPPFWDIIEQRYWPHRVPPRQIAEPALDASGPTMPSDLEYAHLVGWRRIRV